MDWIRPENLHQIECINDQDTKTFLTGKAQGWETITGQLFFDIHHTEEQEKIRLALALFFRNSNIRYVWNIIKNRG